MKYATIYKIDAYSKDKEKFRYVLKHYFLWSGLILTESQSDTFDITFSYNDLKDNSCNVIKFLINKNECLNHKDVIITEENNIVTINCDIITYIYSLLGYADEQGYSSRGNILSDHQYLKDFEKYSSIDVNEIFLKLHNAFLKLSTRQSFLTRSSLPGNSKFCLCLTHDVDYLQRSFINRLKLFRNTAKILRNKELKNVNLKQLIKFSLNKNPYSFDILKDIEKKYGFSSSLNISGFNSAGQTFINKSINPSYNISEAKEKIKLNDHFEIGMHGSTISYNDKKTFIDEHNRVKTLGNCKGGRQHMLAMHFPITFDLMEDAGYAYDTSIGFNDYNGFRGRNAIAHKPLNLSKHKEYSFFEFPLLFMDSVFTKKGILDSELILSKFQILIDRLAKLKGVGSVCWHDMAFYKNSFLASSYDKILKAIKLSNGTATTPMSLTNYLKSCENISLLQSNDNISISFQNLITTYPIDIFEMSNMIETKISTVTKTSPAVNIRV